MSFHRTGIVRSFYTPNIPPSKSEGLPLSKGGVSLRSSMIDRVYSAKPGCSACGKRVV